MQGRPSSGQIEYLPLPEDIAREAARIRAGHSPLKVKHARRRAVGAEKEPEEKVAQICTRCDSFAQRAEIARLAASYHMSLNSYCLAAMLGTLPCKEDW